MSYFITGGAGFIGSHVAEQLLTRSETVVILDNFNDYYDPAIKRRNIERLNGHKNADNLTVVEGDIRDAVLVNTLFAKHHVQQVAHLAAMAGVRPSMTQTPLYMDVNLTGSMNIFEAAREHDVKQTVFASTSSVYGKTEVLPFIETDTADRPLAAYPASKRAVELLAHTYNNLNQMNIICLRFFNVYGPAGRPDMMPLQLMEATLSGKQMTLFNGGDISRDWTYIDDTVKGVIAALDRPMGYEVINLGVGKPVTLTDFVEMIEEYSGRPINKISVETPPSEPPITFCNNEKARRLLDFAPEITVQEGLLRTWEWFRDYKEL
ncbi:MAG: SDR family NAD(P)-dependent oxidoreductase [Aggregatilineales bacterium]